MASLDNAPPELLAAADTGYRESVLPPVFPRLAVEAASSFAWDRCTEASVCVDHFGTSEPGPGDMGKFGLTRDDVAKHAREPLDEIAGRHNHATNDEEDERP